MTFQQMYDNAMVLWDKAGSPYMPQSSFDIFANNKYNDWVEMMGKAVEQDERLMADIQYLFTTFSKANSNTIDRVVDVPTFRRRIRMNITFTDPCSTTTPPKILTRNVRPVSNATIDVIQDDPFMRGIDEDPIAVATQLPNGNPGWQEFGDTVPLSFNMTFIRVPQVINSAGSPATSFEGQDYIANYIIRMVVYNMDVTIESYNRSKMEQEDLARVLS